MGVGVAEKLGAAPFPNKLGVVPKGEAAALVAVVGAPNADGAGDAVPKPLVSDLVVVVVEPKHGTFLSGSPKPDAFFFSGPPNIKGLVSVAFVVGTGLPKRDGVVWFL